MKKPLSYVCTNLASFKEDIHSKIYDILQKQVIPNVYTVLGDNVFNILYQPIRSRVKLNVLHKIRDQIYVNNLNII